VDNDPLTLDCLELASLEEHDAYYQRLSVLVRRSQFDAVMARLEQLVDQGLVGYASAKYVLTPAGRLQVVATQPTNGALPRAHDREP
jgi:predicted transcriptional regulator